jgi:hypothetical protein
MAHSNPACRHAFLIWNAASESQPETPPGACQSTKNVLRNAA